MQISRTLLDLPFAYAVSTPATNFGRARDSNPNSVDNLKNISAMQESCGWSPEYPMVAITMRTFPKEVGMTAVEYLAKEISRRADNWEARKTATLKADLASDKQADANRDLKAYEDLYCETVDGVKQLIQLTVDNAYWVHSGHQRTQFVFLLAYTEFLKRQEADDEDLKEFHLTVPCLTASYTDFMDLLENQVASNSSAANQNKLTVMDFTHTAVQAMGNGLTPKIKESTFRRWGAEKNAKAANSGAYPRLGYKLALLNFAFLRKPKFYDALVENPKLEKKDGEKEALDNPKYIDYKEFSLSGADPMRNVAVISRLLDYDLLVDYDKNYGNGLEAVAKGEKPNPLCAAEREVLRRSLEAGKPLPWTEEEFIDWMETMKHGTKYVRPVETTAKVTYKTDKARDVIASAAPQVLKDFMNEHVFGAENGAEHKIAQRVEAFDLVYRLDPTNDNDLAVLEALASLATFREGNPEGYGAFVADFRKICDQYLPKPSGTVDTSGTTEATGTPEVSTDTTGTVEGNTDSATAESAEATSTVPNEEPSTAQVDATTEPASKPTRGRRSGK